jgi:hypothetical protein
VPARNQRGGIKHGFGDTVMTARSTCRMFPMRMPKGHRRQPTARSSENIVGSSMTAFARAGANFHR